MSSYIVPILCTKTQECKNWSSKYEGCVRFIRYNILNEENKDIYEDVKYEVKCHDCGMLYGGDDWIDTVLTNEQWDMVFPEHDGILCANCIIKRASKLEPIRAEMKIIFAKK